MVRIEEKYLITSGMKQQIMPLIEDLMEPDQYQGSPLAEYLVSSLYLDTQKLASYQAKKSGDEVRQKYRIRKYNNSSDVLYLEVKRKIGKQTHKSHIPVKGSQVPVEDWLREIDIQSSDHEEFIHDVHKYNLRPVIWIHYLRSAYRQRNNSDVKITLDREIRYENCTSKVTAIQGPAEEWNESIFSGGRTEEILELKYSYIKPAWFSTLVKSLALEPVSVSKYILALEKKELTYGNRHFI